MRGTRIWRNENLERGHVGEARHEIVEREEITPAEGGDSASPIRDRSSGHTSIHIDPFPLACEIRDANHYMARVLGSPIGIPG